MKINAEPFQISPRIVPAGEVAKLTIRGRFSHSDLRNFSGKLIIEVVGADGLFANGDLPGYTCFNGFHIDDRPMFEPMEISTPDDSGKIEFNYFFRGEGTNTFRIRINDQVLGTISVFSLRREYWQLRPFKGDMHIHSGCSGCNQERLQDSPEYMAAIACAKGMDFISISDHKQLTPGIRAAEFTRQCGGHFRAIASEEVHQSDLHTIHMLNFGGKHGVSCRLRPGEAQYDKLLKHYLQIVPQFTDHWLRYLAANWHIACDWIRESDGLAVFCHPFWRPFERLFLPECIREYILEKQLFDCIELFGGHHDDIADSWYKEACISSGRLIPAVGNTDSHKCDDLGLKYSVIFAKNNSVGELQQAVKANRCVAVSNENGMRCSGLPVMVKFFHFLKQNYYPRHELLCRRESELMLQALDSGTPDTSYTSFVNENRQSDFTTATDLAMVHCRPDQTAYAALLQKYSALENEFWG